MSSRNEQHMAEEAILEFLKQKGVLSDLEKDIISTIEVYKEKPFDRNRAERRAKENYVKYPDLFMVIRAKPGIVNKSFSVATDEEVHQNLYLQIQAMWAKKPMMS